MSFFFLCYATIFNVRELKVAMIGFDYGTSNCSVAKMHNGHPEILQLVNGSKTIASNLYAPDRDIICHWLSQQLSSDQQQTFKIARTTQLQKSQRALRELAYDGIEPDLVFGKAALDKYLEDPEEGYYIKSPKVIFRRQRLGHYSNSTL